MRRWQDSTFVFVSANPRIGAEDVEYGWIPVMRALAANGATVRLLVPQGSEIADDASSVGIHVDQYLLDRWNVVKARSRLRKYLRRYAPVAAHSTGVEADLMLRWAARRVPETEVVHTVTDNKQGTRRSRPVDALMRRYDELGMRTAAAVFVSTSELVDEVRAAGVAQDRVHLVAASSASRAGVDAQMDVYRAMMAARG
jgi:hypothetical protein